MITVTGATGALNGATVDHLLDLLPARDLTVVVRDPARAQRFAERGVAVRRGGYDDAAALREAFAGADTVLLVSSNDRGADTVALHRTAVDAAAAAGVGRVVYTSHQGASATSPFPPAVVHAATEDLLAASGLAWTALRNGFYTHTLGWLLGPWRATGRVRVPHEGPVSWTAREDVAEAAALLLARGGHDGPTTLTAAAAPTFAEVAEQAGQLLGRPVALEVVGPRAWLEEQVAAGTPEPAARFTLAIFEAAAQGGLAGTDPLLGTVLARAPRTVRDVLAG